MFGVIKEYVRSGKILNTTFRQCSRLTTERVITENTQVSRDHLTPELSLHLITPSCKLWSANPIDVPFADPFWAFYWPGGQALSRYILDNSSLLSSRKIIDIGSGSGACAIAAAKIGAQVTANDIDPVSRVAIALNTALNEVTVDISSENLIGKTQLKWDCVLIGDMFYDEVFARTLLSWLRILVQGGALVLVGDPGRTLLQQELHKSSDILVAQYALLDNTCLENNGFTDTFVWQLSS
uniref:ETFB lysine methyltransferase n=1 Tax=Timema tahoe TaxID=61484 RepID=A0A7R9NXM1_9NEOP|nr:unnamed protein product [Timema tahoe]